MGAQELADRVKGLRTAHAARDIANSKLIAIRKGDYESVAPGLFNTAEFDKPLVANLIDTAARDIAETMAPLPGIDCQSGALSSDANADRQEKRTAVANAYMQHSRLQDQMYGGADRYGSFGFMALIAETDFDDQAPRIRVGDVATAYYSHDFRGRCREYIEVVVAPMSEIVDKFGWMHEGLQQMLYNRYGSSDPHQKIEVARWYDSRVEQLVLLDPAFVLVETPNRRNRCNVRIVERPSVTDEVRGQYDDVIWVQIARALVQMYTMNALEQSVNAPMVVPRDVNEIELGANSVIQTDGQVQRVQLNMTPGLFPEAQSLANEQRQGSRYPEGRSGSIDASIITGQGVQALMGTFDTQVQTFQRLFASALEDVIAMCFEIDEMRWGAVKKTIYVRESGSSRKITYTPGKDIAGDYSVSASYGAIAGLDPNRGLVFTLQALAGKLMSRDTAMKTLPVDMNVQAEERQMQLEQMDDSIASSISMLAQAIPQMAMGGADPRELVLQIVELRKRISKGENPADAIEKVFAPPEQPEPEAPSPLDQAQGAGAGPEGLPGAGGGGASDMLMMLAGMTPSGNVNSQANVSRMIPTG